MSGQDVLLGADTRERISRALYEIHRPSRYMQGFSEEGWAWLEAGKSLGPEPHQMPLEVGMRSFTKCRACETAGGKPQTNRWPCDTVKLLLEAGILLPLDGLGIEFESASGVVQHNRVGECRGPLAGTFNVRPDQQMEVLPVVSG